MVKVMKSFEILTISKLWSSVYAETIASLAYFGRKIFEALLMLVLKIFLTTPPPSTTFSGNISTTWSKHDDPPPNVDVFTTSPLDLLD